MLAISIRDKNGEERLHVFEKEEVTIGRTAGSDIVLPRNNISKRHARLVDKDHKVVIVDLRSTNGTYLNGRRITAPEILGQDDKIYIGDFVVRLVDAEQAAALQSEPPPPGPPGRTHSVGAGVAAQQAAQAHEASLAADLDEADDLFAEKPPPPPPLPAGPPSRRSMPTVAEASAVEATRAMSPVAAEDAGAWSGFELGEEAPPPGESPMAAVSQAAEIAASLPEPVATDDLEELESFGAAEVLDAAARTDFGELEFAEEAPAETAAAEMPTPWALLEEPAAKEEEVAILPWDEARAPEPPPKRALPVPTEPVAEEVPVPEAVPTTSVWRPVELPPARTSELDEDLAAAIEAVRAELASRGAAAALREAEDWAGFETEVHGAIGAARAAGALTEGVDDESVCAHVIAEEIGLGVLGDLLGDDQVTAIFVNGPDRIAVSRAGEVDQLDRKFPSATVLELITQRLADMMWVSPGPVFNGNLPGGDSVEVVGRMVAPAGPVIVVRRPSAEALTPFALMQAGALPESGVEYLRQAVLARKNIIISGRQGSGRTTVVNALCYLIPSHERIAVVESVRTLKPPHDNVVLLDREGLNRSGEDLADLMPRLCADRVIVDEVSGVDAFGFVSLGLAGHDGLMGVMTGSDPHELLNRLVLQLELVAGARFDDRARAMVAEAIDVIVQVVRGADGKSVVAEILEVEGASATGFKTRKVGLG
jgi:pilus assembly protein CpaF